MLPQALRVVVPPLGSQFILLMLNSSVVSVISADELTAAAQDVQWRTFRPFEAYIIATVIYLCLSLLFSGAVRRDRAGGLRPQAGQRDEDAQPRRFRVPACWRCAGRSCCRRWRRWAAASIGMVIALLRVSKSRAARWFAIGYIRLFQGTPLLLQLFLVFFGADMLGCRLGRMFRPRSGFSLNAGAFLGEIWRGSIQAVPNGQVEAAQALGLHYWPRMLRIVLPQALRMAIPPTVGFLVNLIKSTSLAAIIGFVELTRAGQMLNNATFRPFLIFGTVAAIYFVLCWPLTIASRRLEARLAVATRR